MELAASSTIHFVPTLDAEAARVFYEEILGLTFERDDRFALVFRVGPAPGSMLRIVRVPEFAPQPFTILGWEVDDLERSVTGLTAKGVIFLLFTGLEQDARGIWRSPDGSQIAWFQDPDGNTLSLSQHAR